MVGNAFYINKIFKSVGVAVLGVCFGKLIKMYKTHTK